MTELQIENLTLQIKEANEDDLERKSSLLRERGEAYLKMGDFVTAIRDLTSSIVVGSSISSLHKTYFLRGKANLGLKNPEEASEDFTKAIGLAIEAKKQFITLEEREKMDSILCTYYLSRGRSRSLLPDIEIIGSIDDDFGFAKAFSNDYQTLVDIEKERKKVLRKIRKNKEQVNKYINGLSNSIKNSEDIFPFLVQRSRIYYILNRDEEALHDLEKILTEHNDRLSLSDEVFLRQRRAVLNEEEDYFERSLIDLDFIINNFNKAFNSTFQLRKLYFLNYRASLHKSLENKDSSLSDYISCVDINMATKNKGSDWRKRCHNLKTKIGEIYFSQRKFSEAVDEYSWIFDQMEPSELEKWTSFHQDLLDIGEDLQDVHANRIYERDDNIFDLEEEEEEEIGRICQLCLNLSVKVFSKLIDMVKSENDLEKGFLTSYSLRSDSFYHMDEYQKAIKDINIVIRNNPSYCDGVSFYDRGVCYEELGKDEEMIKDFKKFLDFKKVYIGEIEIGDRSAVIGSLYEAFQRKEDSFLEFYYCHLHRSTLAKCLCCNELDSSDRNLPDDFYDTVLEGGLEVPEHDEEPGGEDIFVDIGLFMAYTALYRLKDPEKMFEIVMYFTVLRQSILEESMNGLLFDKLLRNHFFEDERKNRVERLEFIIDSGILSNNTTKMTDEEEEEEGEEEEEEDSSVINVKWNSCDQNIFIKKYFFKDRDVQKSIELSEKIGQIDPMIIYKILFGVNLSDDELFDDIFKLFFFFQELRLYGHIYTLCKSVKQLNLEKKVKLFVRSISEFENEESFDTKKADKEMNGKESEVSFNSPISLSIFNELKGLIEGITKVPGFVKGLDQVGYLKKLEHSKSKDVKDHSFFQTHINYIPNNDDYDGELDFEKYFDLNLKSIHDSKQYTCHTLTTKDGVVFPVHKEILTLRSNFFYQMFKFPGTESSDKNIMIEDLCGDSLCMLLESIYLNDIEEEKETSSSDLRNMFELLIHSEMYHNLLLKSISIQRIDKLFTKYAEEDELVLRILESGKYLEKTPQWFQDLMARRWEFLYSKGELIKEVMKRSIKIERMANSQREEIKRLKEELKRKNRGDDDDKESQPVKKKRKKD